MASPKISIIMPVYNVEKYIEKSINAVLEQSFTDFELLLIDDCTPDKSGEICDVFAKLDNRIKVVHLSENGGVSNARNTLMKIAGGEYICFLDSDDYFDRNMLSVLVESVTKNPAKAVIFGLVEEYFNEAGILKGSKRVSYKDVMCNTKEQVRQELLHLEALDLYGYPCNKMYNTDYLRECKAVFPIMRFNEDIIFNIDYFMDVDSCNIIDFAPYHYVKHSGSKTGGFIPTYYVDIMRKIDRLYEQLKYWDMMTAENLNFISLRYTRYLFSALERNNDRRAKMSPRKRREMLEKEMQTERYKNLSPYLDGKGLIGIMAKALKCRNKTLCLVIGKAIFVVKKYLPKLFVKIS